MKEEEKFESNSVAYVYRGIEIQKYPRINIRVDQITMQEIIDASIESGMSYREILGYSSRPCECCQNKGVVVFDRKDQKITIKRGILSKRIPKHD